MYRGDLGFWNSRTFLIRTLLVRTFLVAPSSVSRILLRVLKLHYLITCLLGRNIGRSRGLEPSTSGSSRRFNRRVDRRSEDLPESGHRFETQVDEEEQVLQGCLEGKKNGQLDTLVID